MKVRLAVAGGHHSGRAAHRFLQNARTRAGGHDWDSFPHWSAKAVEKFEQMAIPVLVLHVPEKEHPDLLVTISTALNFCNKNASPPNFLDIVHEVGALK